MLRVLDLFSGIGGFSLGLERTGGFRTVAFCEIDPYCQRVLRRHWPTVFICTDIRELDATGSRGIDVICGGFPCQDISLAGKGAGIVGERSGLWSEYLRLISEIRPSYVIVENVAGLLSRGLGRVLGDLAEIGYDAEWHCIQAADVGAPHLRDRIWIVAHPGCLRPWACEEPAREGPALRLKESLHAAKCNRWPPEPGVGRVANGIPGGLDRRRALGNSIVPQIAQAIGQAILEAEERCRNP